MINNGLLGVARRASSTAGKWALKHPKTTGASAGVAAGLAATGVSAGIIKYAKSRKKKRLEGVQNGFLNTLDAVTSPVQHFTRTRITQPGVKPRRPKKPPRIVGNTAMINLLTREVLNVRAPYTPLPSATSADSPIQRILKDKFSTKTKKKSQLPKFVKVMNWSLFKKPDYGNVDKMIEDRRSKAYAKMPKKKTGLTEKQALKKYSYK
jgi:hypothetical protein